MHDPNEQGREEVELDLPDCNTLTIIKESFTFNTFRLLKIL